MLQAAALLLLAMFALGMVRVLIGPTRADRMMAAQLFGTIGVAVLLLVGRLQEDRALIDVALVLALLALLAAVAFVRRASSRL